MLVFAIASPSSAVPRVPSARRRPLIEAGALSVLLEIHRNTLFLLHVLKDLRGYLFYMLCTVFRRILLILLTFSDS